MTAFGKANYDRYRDFSHGTSLVTGAPIPEWDNLPVHIQGGWDAAADAVLALAAEGDKFAIARPTADGGMAVMLADEIRHGGYTGPAQHTYTTSCDGFHEPGQCSTPEKPTRHYGGSFFADDDPFAEANAAGAL